MAITPNMTLIEAVTVGSGGVSSINFTSIPQTYTDLLIQGSVRTSHAANWGAITFQINGSSSNQTVRRMYGGDSTVAVDTTNLPIIITGSTATSSTFGMFDAYIHNYTGSQHKSMTIDSNNESNDSSNIYQVIAALNWADSSAITSISLTPNTGPFVQYSTVYLYGITAAKVNAKATGGAIYSDADYFYHVFASSGTFTPTQSLTCDYLMIGGGGGGGGIVGGGGGAGQVVSALGQSFTATAYTVTIGGGGSSPAIANPGVTGGTTTFNSVNAIGGGGGGNYNGGNGLSGASGGGGGGSEPAVTSGTGGTGTAGFNGGNGTGFGIGATYAGGGGGGAGGAGANAVQPSGATSGSSIAGNGGIGATNSFINAIALATGYGQYDNGNYYIAAGGGGASGNSLTNIGFGGIGGGGNGGANEAATKGTNGLVNTGSGGGGARDNLGGNGAAGLVVIRYAK